MEYKQETENFLQSQRRREVPWWRDGSLSTNPLAHSGKTWPLSLLSNVTLITSSHMGSMGTHPLSSPMSSYYSAGMGAAMPGLSPNFGMPVSMYSAGSSSMGMTAMSMSGVGTVGGMTSQGLVSATSYPSSSSPYPGEWGIFIPSFIPSFMLSKLYCAFQEVPLPCPPLCSTQCWTEKKHFVKYQCTAMSKSYLQRFKNVNEISEYPSFWAKHF